CGARRLTASSSRNCSDPTPADASAACRDSRRWRIELDDANTLAAHPTMRALNQITDAGFCMLPGAVDAETLQVLRDRCHDNLAATGEDRNARSSGGHFYAARNVLELVPESLVVWRQGLMLETLRQVLGEHF